MGMTQIKVVAEKYTGAGENSGKPFLVTVTMSADLIDIFPKSVKVSRTARWDGDVKTPIGHVEFRFATNAVTGSLNDASVKRYRSFVRIVQRNGLAAEWATGRTSYMTREELEASFTA